VVKSADLATSGHWLEKALADAADPGHQVFVSYGHDDWTPVDGIVRQIEGFGYKVWVDRQDRSSGRYAGAICSRGRAVSLH
jgi:hypothetical protein